jgi:hypothetical protein
MADVWSTGRWSPGRGTREGALGHDGTHLAAEAGKGARRHLDAGDGRNGSHLEGGRAIGGHTERRRLSRVLELVADHAGHLLRVLGAGLAKGRDALSVTSSAERYRGPDVTGKPFSGHFSKTFFRARALSLRRARWACEVSDGRGGRGASAWTGGSGHAPPTAVPARRPQSPTSRPRVDPHHTARASPGPPR